jgi:hypothetical protein
MFIVLSFSFFKQKLNYVKRDKIINIKFLHVLNKNKNISFFYYLLIIKIFKQKTLILLLVHPFLEFYFISFSINGKIMIFSNNFFILLNIWLGLFSKLLNFQFYPHAFTFAYISFHKKISSNFQYDVIINE